METLFSNVVVTTDSLDRAKPFYLDFLGLLPVEESVLDQADMRRFWGLDTEYPVRSLVLKRRSEDAHGYLRLVEIVGAEGHDLRAGIRPWDYGLLDFGFTVADGGQKIAAIEAAGYEVLVRPTRYDFPTGNPAAPYYVVDALVAGPNHVAVDLLERFNAPYPYGAVDSTSGLSEVVHSAQFVPDMAGAIHFYRDLLGLPIRLSFQNHVEPQFERMLKIPPDTVLDWGFFCQPPGKDVEVIALRTCPGRQIPGQGNMLNYGVAALSLLTDDVREVFQRVKGAGVPVVCEPMAVCLEAGVSTLAFTCLGPSQILCELRQRPE